MFRFLEIEDERGVMVASPTSECSGMFQSIQDYLGGGNNIEAIYLNAWMDGSYSGTVFGKEKEPLIIEATRNRICFLPASLNKNSGKKICNHPESFSLEFKDFKKTRC